MGVSSNKRPLKVMCSYKSLRSIMMCRILFFAVFFALFCLVFLNQIANASLKVEAFSGESRPAVVRLECFDEARNSRYVSLGGVLNTQLDSISDIVLVAAHALKTSIDQCVISFKDQRLSIVRAESGSEADADGDWAVLTLDGRFDGPISRLAWHTDSANTWEAFAVNGGRVSLLKLPNGDAGKDCDVRVPKGGMIDPNDGKAVIVSDCVSMPGMSGAPALVEVDGVPAIIGFNIGTRYVLGDAPVEWRSRASVIRLVDINVENAIVRAISQEIR